MKPYLPVQARIGKEVVGGCRVPACEAGNAGPTGPRPRRHPLQQLLVLDRNGDDGLLVLVQLARNLGCERQVSAEVLSHQGTVDPDPAA